MDIEFIDLTIDPPTSHSWRGKFLMINPTNDKAKYVMKWMRENHIEEYTTVIVDRGLFCFGYSKDSFAFKLKWL